jgi:hypothetical protein
MDNQEDNDLVKSIIQASLNIPPEKLTSDFYLAAAHLPRWHLLMLQDRRRLEYYSDVIRPKVEGKVVLDVGTGSGILSHMALKWGARKVYSIEQNPALQAVYRHLMRTPLESGQAELFCDDALFLRLDQFSEGAPDVIVHELFGSIGMGENLIPIFRALVKEGILTDKTTIVPDLLEVWMRPVFSELMGQEGQVEAFDDYPLQLLNIFGSQSFFEQEYIASRSCNWQTTASDQLLFKCHLRDLTLPEQVVLKFSASHATHLKLWMKIADTASGLIHANDHQEVETHWANSYLAIPGWLRNRSFQVEFNIHPNGIQVSRFIP